MKLANVRQWLAEQRAWIESRGGSLAGYLTTYGSKSEPNHYGDGGEAIYAADRAELDRLEALASRIALCTAIRHELRSASK